MNQLTTQLNSLQSQIDELKQQISPSTQEVVPFAKEAQQAGKFFETKSQTKYRKNGALVFAPESEQEYWHINQNLKVESWLWSNETIENFLLQKGLIFDNEQACQFWADKLKIAYELKQRIVESESQSEVLDYTYIYWDLKLHKKDYLYIGFKTSMNGVIVSTIAKDILMSDDVSDEDYKAFIEVESL